MEDTFDEYEKEADEETLRKCRSILDEEWRGLQADADQSELEA